MLKSILLSSLLFLSQQTNAANYSAEDSSYSGSTSSSDDFAITRFRPRINAANSSSEDHSYSESASSGDDCAITRFKPRINASNSSSEDHSYSESTSSGDDFAITRFRPKINAANSSSEDYSYSESTDSEYISSSDDELDAQDLLEERRLLDVISVKLWELYAAQKQKLGMANSEAKIKTAWLITMRTVVPRVVDLAMKYTHERYSHMEMDFIKIIRWLVYSLRTEEMAYREEEEP